MVREIQDVTQADIAKAVGGDLLHNESMFIRQLCSGYAVR
jgi:hypothetical protein